jgi:pimeloyl-ACP methyl ester carboxylesterase
MTPRQTISRRVDIGDLTFRIISTVRETVANRPPIVLVHGVGMSHRYLQRLHRVLAEVRPTYSVDLPGYAGLPKPRADVDVPTMGRALSEVVSSFTAEPVVILGHSMGAQWVVEAALHRPDLVDMVVTMGPVTDRNHRTATAQVWALTLDTLMESPFANGIVFTDYVRCGVPWYLAQTRHMLAYPIERRVAQLAVPLLVIRGARDPIAGLAWCRQLRDRAAEGHLVQIPQQPHVAQHSRPKAVASAVLDYADRASRSPKK